MAGLDLYQMLWFFVLYAFLGWCTEVVYAVVTTGEFVNRGFLNGPVCPIYGFGVVGVVLSLSPISENILALFLGSVVLTSFLEWLTGFVLEKLFKSKWWDYSDKPFNVSGYICLAFSILWGLGCVFIIRLVHPMLGTVIDILPKWLGLILLLACMGALTADFIVTVVSVVGFNKRLDQLERIALRLRNLSDELGENLSEQTLELELLLSEQRTLLEARIYSHRRLLRAFPRLRSHRAANSLEKLKEHYRNIKKIN